MRCTDVRAAIMLWRAKCKYGLSLPMLCACDLYLQGKEITLDACKKNVRRVLGILKKKEVLSSECEGVGYCVKRPIIIRFFCTDTGMAVHGVMDQGHPRAYRSMGAMRRQYMNEHKMKINTTYPWTGVSKNNGAWGMPTEKDMAFFEEVKQLCEREARINKALK